MTRISSPRRGEVRRRPIFGHARQAATREGSGAIARYAEGAPVSMDAALTDDGVPFAICRTVRRAPRRNGW
jgi:hypothetical protein